MTMVATCRENVKADVQVNVDAKSISPIMQGDHARSQNKPRRSGV
jgi:hypothetical protein